ncbi:MAG TPA: amidohydrolase, partial [Gammaproteobacteria bacterium]|nr:amidohydrolase [Gammaproteobacteria bacterium]HIB25586.1 amidohydrolase [Gammaproteobacteria bacterium]
MNQEKRKFLVNKAKISKLRLLFVLLIAFTLIASCDNNPPSMEPELIVFNADIRTVDQNQNRAEAFAIKDGRFVAVGNNEDVLDLKGTTTESINANGATIVPGFIDSHTHLSSGSKIVTGINLTGIREKSVWLEMIAERVKTMEPGEWLLGGRWDYTFENKGLPTRWELDNVSPNNPIALSDIDGHSMWVNSLAIEKANIRANSEVPLGGQILVNESSGEPNGILLEGAMQLIWDAPTYIRDSDLSRDKIEQVLDYANSFGITGVHDMSSRIELEKYKDLAINKKLFLRVFWGEMSKFTQEDDNTNNQKLINQLIREYKFHDQDVGPLIEYGFIKYVIDGVLSTHTAALIDPYSDRPEIVGEPFYIQGEINRLVKRANSLGMPVAIHAIGDRGVKMALNAFEYSGNTSLANRIEHIEIIEPSDIDRFKKLNVTASMQPNHGTGVIGKYITPRVGLEREKYAYVWNDFLRSEVRLALSSDFATSPFSPLVQLADAVFRESPSGLYEGPWYPQQALSFEQALYAYTQVGADLAGWGDQIGSISVGKWADFVVLDGALNDPVGR